MFASGPRASKILGGKAEGNANLIRNATSPCEGHCTERKAWLSPIVSYPDPGGFWARRVPAIDFAVIMLGSSMRPQALPVPLQVMIHNSTQVKAVKISL